MSKGALFCFVFRSLLLNRIEKAEEKGLLVDYVSCYATADKKLIGS